MFFPLDAAERRRLFLQARPPVTSLSEPVCKKCPALFKRIADIPIEEKDINTQITYKETLEKGYRYIYKVTVYADNGVTGKDSNYIDFIY